MNLKNLQNVQQHVISGAQRLIIGSRVCNTVMSVVQNVCAYHQALMGIKRNVNAIITGKQRKESLNVLDLYFSVTFFVICLLLLVFNVRQKELSRPILLCNDL